jgi:hypothetical protein
MTEINVARLMRDLEADVSSDRRTRLLARGGAAEYRDPELFGGVESLLRRAVEDRDQDVLLLPELFEDDDDWRLQTHLRLTSHRPAIGGLLVYLKRKVLLPTMRWLYEYSLENFRRQQRVNRALLACVEELAIENARLRQEVRRLTGERGV